MKISRQQGLMGIAGMQTQITLKITDKKNLPRFGEAGSESFRIPV
jgi:hypothetical protein